MANEGTFCIDAVEYVAHEALRPIPHDAVGVPTAPNTFIGVGGVRMSHGFQTSLYFVRLIPHELTLATGITFTLVYALADANNAYLGGGNVMLDVVAAPLVSGTSRPDESALVGSIPAQAAMPVPTVPGTIVMQDVAAPVADLVGPGGTLASGNLALIRVRRRGDDPGDSNYGDILFISLGLRNT